MDDQVDWHRVVVPFINYSDPYDNEVAWCYRNAPLDSWRVGLLHLPIDADISQLMREFKFRDRAVAVQFELTHG